MSFGRASRRKQEPPVISNPIPLAIDVPSFDSMGPPPPSPSDSAAKNGYHMSRPLPSPQLQVQDVDAVDSANLRSTHAIRSSESPCSPPSSSSSPSVRAQNGSSPQSQHLSHHSYDHPARRHHDARTSESAASTGSASPSPASTPRPPRERARISTASVSSLLPEDWTTYLRPIALATVVPNLSSSSRNSSGSSAASSRESTSSLTEPNQRRRSVRPNRASGAWKYNHSSEVSPTNSPASRQIELDDSVPSPSYAGFRPTAKVEYSGLAVPRDEGYEARKSSDTDRTVRDGLRSPINYPGAESEDALSELRQLTAPLSRQDTLKSVSAYSIPDSEQGHSKFNRSPSSNDLSPQKDAFYRKRALEQVRMPPKGSKGAKSKVNETKVPKVNGNSKSPSKSEETHGNETEESDVEGFEDAEGGDESPQHTRQVQRDSEDEDEQNLGDEVDQSSVVATDEDIAAQAANPGPLDAPATPKASHAPVAVEKGETATPTKAAAPPPPPRRPSMSTESAPRNSQSSLWDRLKSPAADKATAPKQQDRTSPTSPTTPISPPTAQRRASHAPSFLNTLTSAANSVATSAASRGFQLPERLGGGQAAAASLSGPGSASARKRLPRHEVDEAKVMDDQMRFAEARHLLATSKSLEEIRQLGKDLETGWREKLAEVTELHLKLEDLTHSVSDIEDENTHLRGQMADLSEEIARREEDFEGFQQLTLAHQIREKELWETEVKEERERLEWKEREAVRILAEERAINAQLRVALLGSMNGVEGGLAGALAAGSRTDLGKTQRSSVVSSSSQSNSRRSAVFDSYDSETSSQSIGVDSPPLERHGIETSSSSGGGEDGSIQDDVLFNLNLSHTSGNGAISPPSASSASYGASSTTLAGGLYSSLLSDVVPLDQLRLLLKFNPEEDSASMRSVLGDVPSQYQSDQQRPQDDDSSSQRPGGGTLEHHLLSLKGLSDFHLSQALQMENFSLRSRAKDEEKEKKALEEECRILKDKVRGMEEAIGGLLEVSTPGGVGRST